jgi:hypothetical protein
MTPRHDGDPTPQRDERAFGARLAERYAPPPLTPEGRRAFDRALGARLERRRRRRILVPALATAAAAAAVVLALRAGRLATTPAAPVTPAPVVADTRPTVQWENQLVSATDVDDASTWDEQELPADYEAIADAWLAG